MVLLQNSQDGPEGPLWGPSMCRRYSVIDIYALVNKILQKYILWVLSEILII